MSINLLKKSVASFKILFGSLSSPGTLSNSASLKAFLTLYFIIAI